MAHIYITRHIPEVGIEALRSAGHIVHVSQKDGVLSRGELIAALQAHPYDAVLCLLTDTIDEEVFRVVPSAKIFANYAVGYNNINLVHAAASGVTITNTPGVLTNAVAEFTIALMLAVTKRIPESERFLREGKYTGWGPELLLGSDLSGKVLGILGAGRIGYEVARRAYHGFDMKVAYYDIQRMQELEETCGATFYDTVEGVLGVADVVSIHVPLIPATEHLINSERLACMKRDAYLINTSRGPVVDEEALVVALREGVIRGAGLDVFEHEPALAPGLAELSNVVVTPHIASATNEARNAMSRIAAENIIDFLAGRVPQNVVTLPQTP